MDAEDNNSVAAPFPETPSVESAFPAQGVKPKNAEKKRRRREQVDYEALLMAHMPAVVRQRRPIATFALVAASVIVAVFLYCETRSFNPDPRVYIGYGANFRRLTAAGQSWRLVTSSFLHFGLEHLAFNMLCLFVLGRFLEKVVGHANLLCVYLLTACTGGLLSLVFHDNTVCAGASGAVFGVFGASISVVALLWRKYQIDPKCMWGYMKNGLSFVGINFIYSLMPGIDMAGHVGGLLGGLVAGAVMAVPLLMDAKPAGKWFQRGVWGATALVAAALACSFVVNKRGKTNLWNAGTADREDGSGLVAEADVRRTMEDAERGDADAQYKLAIFYFRGQGVNKDMVETARWLRKAAEQGHAEAMCDLAIFCENGVGVKMDAEEALRLYRKAAALGNAAAQYNLGLYYVRGELVPKDEAEAVKWFRRSAAQGFALAQYNLGVCHSEGFGVEKNEAEALRLYRLAAAQGLKEAQNNLGACYGHGNGVPRNAVTAASWYRKAAAQGYALAQMNLGRCYMYGEGVPKDLTEARRWLREAAEQGNEDAAELLKDLESTKSPRVDE